MDILDNQPAETKTRLPPRECAIHTDQGIQRAPLSRRQRRKSFSQAALQILQDQRHDSHVGDLVSRKRLANEFWPQSAQVDDGAAAGEWHDESAHEINRMVRRNYAQVTRAGPEGKNRRNGAALFEVILMGQDAALRPASGTGGINDAR